MLWWHWALIGFGCILSELVLPAFVLIWFGLAALFMTAITYLMPELPLSYQFLFWTISSIAMVILWFSFFKRGHHKSLIGRASAQIIGEIGMITDPVAPFKNGKVRFQKPIVGSDQWDCVANEEIPSGTRVKVTSIDGNILTVEKTGG